MKTIGYYLSNNLESERELEDVLWAKSSVDRLIVITSTNVIIPGIKVKYLRVRHLKKYKNILKFWGSFSYFLSNIANSKTDISFPERNVYLKSKLATHLVNFFWVIKKNSIIKKWLPSFEKLYISIWGIKKLKKNNRIIFYNPLLIHLEELVIIFGQFKKSKICKVAIIKSWDNQFYTQLSTQADCYIVWSESMRDDIKHTHNIGEKKYIIYGARPFKNFIEKYLNSDKKRAGHINRARSFGYACAYGDDFLAKNEILLIEKIAQDLASYDAESILYVRPYPTMKKSQYQGLVEYKNIKIIEIEDAYNAYGSRRNGDDFEKKAFLDLCDVFISLGTSFTIEAEICGVPIVQYYKEMANRGVYCETEIFKRIDICDHLIKYFLGSIETIGSIKDIENIKFIENNLKEKLGLNYDFQSKLSNNMMRDYIKCFMSK
jgi:hypothetical protein